MLAWLALLPTHAGVAQDRSRSPTPEKLWKEYPLNPTAAPSATSSPAALDQAERQPVGTARPRGDGGAPVLVLVLLALLTAGGSVALLGVRRGREGEPHAADVPRPPTSGRAGRVAPALWHGGAGRFTRAAARASDSRATAVVASVSEVGGRGSGGGGDPPAPGAAAVPPAGDRPAVTAPRAPSPPDRRLAWTAEIEWRHSGGESRFWVIARGAGTVTIAQSPPLQWPPSGPAAVQEMTDAAEKLATALTAAGWKALPPGHSWYAKRFAWEPVGPEPAAAEARPDQGAPRLRRRRRRLALLCVVVALGPLAVLQLTSGQDDARVARPAPAARATATPNPSHGTDLSLPLLVLLGLIPLVLVIRETRRALS